MTEDQAFTGIDGIDRNWVYADPRPGIRAYLREQLASRGRDAVITELEAANTVIGERAPGTPASGLIEALLKDARAGDDFSG